MGNDDGAILAFDDDAFERDAQALLADTTPRRTNTKAALIERKADTILRLRSEGKIWKDIIALFHRQGVSVSRKYVITILEAKRKRDAIASGTTVAIHETNNIARAVPSDATPLSPATRSGRNPRRNTTGTAAATTERTRPKRALATVATPQPTTPVTHSATPSAPTPLPAKPAAVRLPTEYERRPDGTAVAHVVGTLQAPVMETRPAPVLEQHPDVVLSRLPGTLEGTIDVPEQPQLALENAASLPTSGSKGIKF